MAHSGEENAFLDFLERYRVPVLVGMAVVVVGLSAGSIYRSMQTASQERASRLLSEARTPDQLRDVVDAYPQAAAAPTALLAMAKEYYRVGDYEQARLAYERFTADYPDHELSRIAHMGRIYCAEGEGRMDEALAAFTAFADAHPAHFLAPQAKLGRARCLEELGRLADARVVYEDFIAASSEDAAWTAFAEDALDRVRREIKRAEGTL